MDDAAPPAYAVRLPDFEGPLDVLLRLIERQELEITRVSLALVADQFLEYCGALPEPEPRVLASFMVVAAKLLYIKSESLLPRPPPSLAVDDEDEEDVGAELVRRLQEYKSIQQVAQGLRERDAAGQHSYPRPANPTARRRPVERRATLGLEGVTLGQLSRLFQRRLQLQLPLTEAPALIPHEVTLEEKVAELEARLAAVGPRGSLAVWPLLLAARSRAEVVITFMAVLELLRRRTATAEQDADFGEILLRRTGVPTA